MIIFQPYQYLFGYSLKCKKADKMNLFFLKICSFLGVLRLKNDAMNNPLFLCTRMKKLSTRNLLIT